MTKHELREQMAIQFMATFLQGAVLPTQEDRNKAFPIVAEIACDAADALLVALEKRA